MRLKKQEIQQKSNNKDSKWIIYLWLDSQLQQSPAKCNLIYHSSDWKKLGKKIMAMIARMGAKSTFCTAGESFNRWSHLQKLLVGFKNIEYLSYKQSIICTINYITSIRNTPRGKKLINQFAKKKLTRLFIAICFMLAKTRNGLGIYGKGNEKERVTYLYVRIVHIGQKKNEKK